MGDGDRIEDKEMEEERRCHVCGRSLSELHTFDRFGNPIPMFDPDAAFFYIERPLGLYDEEAEKAWRKAERAVRRAPRTEDPRSWLIAKYGDKRAKEIACAVQAHDTYFYDWECKDCAELGDDECFEIIRLNRGRRSRTNSPG